MKMKLIRLLPILSALLAIPCFSQSDQTVIPGPLITANLDAINWGPEAIFCGGYIAYAYSEYEYLVPNTVFTGVGSYYGDLYGTSVSESSGSPIEGSSALTFDANTSEHSTNPDFTVDFTLNVQSDSDITATYKYYYTVDGSGEIYLNYDVGWAGYYTGYLPPDGAHADDAYDSYDSGYNSVDTTVNVSELPSVYEAPPGE